MKNILLVGANSSTAVDLYNNYNKKYNFIRLSRNSDLSEVDKFDVLDESTYFKPNLKLDGLVYFPGTINLNSFDNLKISDYQNDFNINFIGLVKTLKYYKPFFNPNSSFVFFSTVAAKKGMPFHASVSSVKSAVIGLTRSLAAEWAPLHRVNCILPSIFQSEMSKRILRNDRVKEKINNNHPLKRYGKVEDISSMVNFLLSDQSSWMTGQDISIDGGISSISK